MLECDAMQGMFKANRLFFMAMIVHALLLEAVAWFLLYYYGNTWSTWITSGILHGIAQVQYGALQHDLFHYTIFNNTKVSNLFHDIDLGLLQVSVLCLCVHSYSYTP